MAFIIESQEELQTRNQESCSLVRVAVDNTKAERELREELEHSLAILRRCLRYLESYLQKSQEEVTLYRHDLGRELDMRDNIQEMFDCQSEELERLQIANSKLNRKCDSVDSSCRWIKKMFFDISESLAKRRKSFKAIRAEREVLKFVKAMVDASL